MLVDFRGSDWSGFDVGGYGERDAVKLRLAIKAVDDDEVAGATCRRPDSGPTPPGASTSDEEA